jgi:hypothetical protein
MLLPEDELVGSLRIPNRTERTGMELFPPPSILFGQPAVNLAAYACALPRVLPSIAKRAACS